MRVVVMVVAVLLGIARGATADELDPAKRARAEELSSAARRKISDANDWAGASDLFRQAYDLTGQLPYLVNVAVSLRKANLPHQSVAAYQRCLDEGGKELTPELRTQILDDIDHIRRESAQVTVRTAGAPAAIELDRRPVGVAAKNEPLVVLVATQAGLIHTLTASRQGFVGVERKLLQLSAGEMVAVELEPSTIATTGTVQITSTPDAADVALLGRGPLGRAPQTVELPAGDYYLHATLRGFDEASERVTVIAGRKHDVLFRMKRSEPSWWAKHKVKVLIAASVVVVGGAAFGTYELLKPDYDGTTIKFP